MRFGCDRGRPGVLAAEWNTVLTQLGVQGKPMTRMPRHRLQRALRSRNHTRPLDGLNLAHWAIMPRAVARMARRNKRSRRGPLRMVYVTTSAHYARFTTPPLRTRIDIWRPQF